MTMQTVSYKRGYIHYTTEGNDTKIEAQHSDGSRKVVSSERAAKEFINSYNGHKNWTHWNVSLYINNEEPLYRMALDYKKRYGAAVGARKLLELLPSKTPDGATYSLTAVRAALVDIDK
jgi:hypothetical protein